MIKVRMSRKIGEHIIVQASLFLFFIFVFIFSNKIYAAPPGGVTCYQDGNINQNNLIPCGRWPEFNCILPEPSAPSYCDGSYFSSLCCNGQSGRGYEAINSNYIVCHKEYQDNNGVWKADIWACPSTSTCGTEFNQCLSGPEEGGGGGTGGGYSGGTGTQHKKTIIFDFASSTKPSNIMINIFSENGDLLFNSTLSNITIINTSHRWHTAILNFTIPQDAQSIILKVKNLADEGAVVLIDNLRFNEGPQENTFFYCSGLYRKWLPDLDPPEGEQNLDPYEYACNGVASYAWTGTKCCGDEQEKGIIEYFLDTKAACIASMPVPNDFRVGEALGFDKAYNDYLYYNQTLYKCSGDYSTTIGYGNVNLTTLSDYINTTTQFSIIGSYYCDPEGIWKPLKEFPGVFVMASKIYDMLNQSDKGLVLCGDKEQLINYNLSKIDDTLKQAIKHMCIGVNFYDDFKVKKVIVSYWFNTSLNASKALESFYPFPESSSDLQDINNLQQQAPTYIFNNTNFFYNITKRIAYSSGNLDLRLLYNRPTQIYIAELEPGETYKGLIGFFRRIWDAIVGLFIDDYSITYEELELSPLFSNSTHLFYEWSNDLFYRASILDIPEQGEKMFITTNILLSPDITSLYNIQLISSQPPYMYVTNATNWNILTGFIRLNVTNVPPPTG